MNSFAPSISITSVAPGMELAMDPGIRRIGLLDAPSVLGWEVQRGIDQRRTLGMNRTTLDELEELERIPRGSAEVLGHVLLATLNELGLYVAGATDGPAAHTRAVKALNVVLERLFELGASSSGGRRRSSQRPRNSKDENRGWGRRADA